MAAFAPRFDHLNLVAGHYHLVYRVDTMLARGRAPVVQAHATLAELAKAADAVDNRRAGYSWDTVVVMAAYSPSGAPMNVAELVAFGRRLRRELNLAKRFPGYVRRHGPVAQTRCIGGATYSRRYHRRIHTAAEYRLNGLVLAEEGEVPCRCARNSANLADSWDDVPRYVERNWKSQHKGRKAWDRVRPVKRRSA